MSRKRAIAGCYILALFFIIPVYSKGTFDNISQNKVEVFYGIAALALLCYAGVSVYGDVFHKGEGSGKRRGCPRAREIAMGAFLAVCLLSALTTQYRQYVFYGVPGFGMGLLSLFIMVVSCGYIARYPVDSMRLFHLLTLSSVFPLLLAIANCLGYDPLHMYPEGMPAGGRPYYISTFGNYGWLSAYLSLVIPIVIYMVLLSERIAIRLLYAAWLVPVAWVVFNIGTQALLLSLAVATLAIVLLKWAPGILRAGQRLSGVPVLAAGGVLYAAMLLVVTRYEDAGNGRGYIWQLSLDLFQSLPLKEKLIGVGPNCYMDALEAFLAKRPELTETFTEQFHTLALTSAHSEYLDYLINTGIAGVAAYLGMLFVFFRTFLKQEKTAPRILAAVCALSYLIYAGFNFSMVCSTPLFFALAGIAIADGPSL